MKRSHQPEGAAGGENNSNPPLVHDEAALMGSDWYRKVLRIRCRICKRVYEDTTHVKTDSIMYLLNAASRGTIMWRLGVATDVVFDDTAAIEKEEEDAAKMSSKELMNMLQQVFVASLGNTESVAHGRRLLAELDAVLKRVLDDEIALDRFKLDAVPFDDPAQVVITRQKFFLRRGIEELNRYIQSNYHGVSDSSVQEVVDRFQLTLNRELKVASKSTVLAKASSVKQKPKSTSMEKKVRDNFRLRLIARLDDELRFALDTQLPIAVSLLQQAVSKDQDTVLAADWRKKELALIDWRKKNLNRVEGGRNVSERLITVKQWTAGIQSAIERFESSILSCFGSDYIVFYKSDRFFAANVRYYFENNIKPPHEEQRSERQLEFCIRSLMPKAMDVFDKRMKLARAVEAIIDELKPDAAAATMITMEIWEQLLSRAQTLCFDAILSECQAVYITTSMKATLNGLMHAIVKTPQQRSPVMLSIDDFRRIFNIVAIQGAKEIVDEINAFFGALKKTSA